MPIYNFTSQFISTLLQLSSVFSCPHLTWMLTIVDDSSPMVILIPQWLVDSILSSVFSQITYSSGWVDTDLSDPEVSGYLKNTSHATNIQASLVFPFMLS